MGYGRNRGLNPRRPQRVAATTSEPFTLFPEDQATAASPTVTINAAEFAEYKANQKKHDDMLEGLARVAGKSLKDFH